MSQELQNYIAQARRVGKSDEEIVKGLLENGWNNNEIQKALTPQIPNKHKDTRDKKPQYKIQQLVFIVFGILFYILLYFLLRFTVFAFSLSTTAEDIRNLQLSFAIPVIFLSLTAVSIIYRGDPSPFGFISNKKIRNILNIFGWIGALLPFLVAIYAKALEFIRDLTV